MAAVNKGFHVLPFPVERQIVVEAGQIGGRRHLVHGLLEIDVTEARQRIHDYKGKTGVSFSFTAFLITCLAQAVASNPLLQAYRNWRNQLIVFDEVDVATLIETEVDHVALPHIIRAANCKTLAQVSDEIRAVQMNPKKGEQEIGRIAQLGKRVPGFVRRLFYRAMRLNPHWLKKYTGTVVISAVGMFTQGGGWAVGFVTFHTMGLTVGSIAERLVMLDGQIVPREFLSVTISFDHDIVDGAPAARFAKCFKELVESSYAIPK